MKAQHYCSLVEKSFSVTTEMGVDAGMKFVGDIGGDGVLEYWDGVAWNAYDESGPGFTFYAPATGLIRLVVNTAPVLFSFVESSQPQ